MLKNSICNINYKVILEKIIATSPKGQWSNRWVSAMHWSYVFLALTNQNLFWRQQSQKWNINKTADSLKTLHTSPSWARGKTRGSVFQDEITGLILGSSQWEMSLQSNAVSHWLAANLESALNYKGRNMYNISDSQDTPYLTLIGELWVVFCVNVWGRKWQVGLKCIMKMFPSLFSPYCSLNWNSCV